MPVDRAPDRRLDPRATRELASMFDGVSRRYDLLNRVMSLGRDGAWRRAMADQVPERARAVLDLCTGSGTSLVGLRRPGRLVLGADASLRMLEVAADTHGDRGWAPRLLCADAFRLPLRDQAVDAVTVAFGIRNLRPRVEALTEIRRCLRPGGTLVVLEAAAPGGGPLATLHAIYLDHLVPLAGRLSPDPSAYVYLSRSIREFGSGPEFEADLDRAGFDCTRRRSFLFGATRLWVARRRLEPPLPGAAGEAGGMQSARVGELARGEMRNPAARRSAEWRWWNGVQLAVALILTVTLADALGAFLRSGLAPSLEPWQRSGMLVLLIMGVIGFAARTLLLALRLLGPPPGD
jgi:demethylmenaquinone methyltransferase/2-methoxy-6-polyprenyl-1,4-benzoquinol methylase